MKANPKGTLQLAIGLISLKDGKHARDIDWQEGKYPVGQASKSLGSHKRTPSLNASAASGLTFARNQPSSENISWSYVPTAGVKMSSFLPQEGVAYGSIPPLEAGDRIGMLVNITEGSVSYFCNGQDLGVAFTQLTPPLLPAVSFCNKTHIRLLFPPPPYSKRNPRMTLLSIGSSTELML